MHAGQLPAQARDLTGKPTEGLPARCQVRLTDVKPCLCASFASCPVLRSPLLLRWQFSLLQLQMSLQAVVSVVLRV